MNPDSERDAQSIFENLCPDLALRAIYVSIISDGIIEANRYRGIIKSCGLAKRSEVAYPWGFHTPTTAASRRKDTPWTRVPQMTFRGKSPK